MLENPQQWQKVLAKLSINCTSVENWLGCVDVTVGAAVLRKFIMGKIASWDNGKDTLQKKEEKNTE